MGVFDYFTKGFAYGVVARNLTYLYQTMLKKYGAHFTSIKGIMRATVYLNMYIYFKNNEVTMSNVNRIIDNLREEESQYADQGCLIDFIFQVQKLMDSIDYPNSVHTQAFNETPQVLKWIIMNVEETVLKVNQGKMRKRLYDISIDGLMNGTQNEELRKMFDIREV